ncbi:MAG: hypothetical protein IKU24_01855 [Clostridia bacterium]|nr:hypothetical protein [Clostridia bacterium]
MIISEKVAYLKGLMEGLDFQAETKEGKIIKLMADILEDMAEEILATQDEVDDINEYLEAVDEDLTNVEEEIFGEYDDCDCDCEDCDDYDCCCEDDEDCYEVTCPHCGNNICFEEMPESKVFPCPACSKEIPLDD